MPYQRTFIDVARAPRRLLMSALLCGTCLSVSSPQAQAQDVSAGKIETVTVTAQKREQNAQDVPISMAIVSGDTLAKANVISLGDLQTIVPNMQVSDNAATRTLYVRGVGGGGRTVAFDPRNSIYLDGVYIGEPMETDAILTDLERVEVLRGPQGYLYGANTDSGAINIITHKPDNSFESKALVSYGNKNAFRLDGMVNVPLVDDKILLRVSAGYQRRDGFIHNITLNKDVDDLDAPSARIQLRLTPSDDFTADLSFDYSSTKSHNVNGEARSGTFGTGTPPPPADKPFVADENYPQLNFNRNVGGSLTLNYDLGNVILTSITGYRDTFRHWDVDLDHSALDFLHFRYFDSYQTFSEEVRLASNSPDSRLSYVVGLFFLGTNAQNDRAVTTDSFGPGFGIPVGATVNTNPQVRNQSYAIFGDADYKLTSTLTLNTGLRISYDVKKLTITQDPHDVPAFVSPLAKIFDLKDRIAGTAVSPMVGLSYSPDENSLYYVRYARGTKSGGFNADYILTPQLGTSLHLAPETVDDFEAGTKLTLLDRRLLLDLGVFYSQYKKYQVSQFTINNTVIPHQIDLRLTNAGTVETYGPELQVTAVPFDDLTLDLQAAYLSATYTSFPDGGGIGVSYSGNRLEYAPKLTGSFTADYHHELSGGSAVYARATVTYHGDQFSSASNAAVFYQGAYTLLSGRIGWEAPNSNWGVAIWGENLTDKVYDLGTFPDTLTTISGAYGTPRTYGVEVTWQH